MNDLQSTFLILSACFSSTSCYFSSGIILKIVPFQLEALCLCCAHSRKKKKKTRSVFPVFCHTTFHHALITCSDVSREGFAQMYHDRDTFDFSQGHVTRNQPLAVPVLLSESQGI